MVWTMQELERRNTGKIVAAETVAAIKPRDIYQAEITEALVNALLDYTGPLGVAPGEWLTVAARETGVDRRFVPGDQGDTAMTVILRIKGSDLQGLRDRTLAREDVRARVDVRHY